MSILIFAVVVLLIIGMLVWAVQQYLPISPNFKNLACFLLVIIGILVVCQRTGVF